MKIESLDLISNQTTQKHRISRFEHADPEYQLQFFNKFSHFASQSSRNRVTRGGKLHHMWLKRQGKTSRTSDEFQISLFLGL